MEKLIAAVLFVFASFTVSAQTQEPSMRLQLSHICDQTDEIVKYLSEEVKMLPKIGSKLPNSSNEGVLTVWVNEKAKVMVVIVTFNKQGVSCFLATGEHLKFFETH